MSTIVQENSPIFLTPQHSSSDTKSKNCSVVTNVAMGAILCSVIALGLLTILGSSGIDVGPFNTLREMTLYGGIAFLAVGVIGSVVTCVKKSQIFKAAPSRSIAHVQTEKSKKSNHVGQVQTKKLETREDLMLPLHCPQPLVYSPEGCQLLPIRQAFTLPFDELFIACPKIIEAQFGNIEGLDCKASLVVAEVPENFKFNKTRIDLFHQGWLVAKDQDLGNGGNFDMKLGVFVPSGLKFVHPDSIGQDAMSSCKQHFHGEPLEIDGQRIPMEYEVGMENGGALWLGEETSIHGGIFACKAKLIDRNAPEQVRLSIVILISGENASQRANLSFDELRNTIYSDHAVNERLKLTLSNISPQSLTSL